MNNLFDKATLNIKGGYYWLAGRKNQDVIQPDHMSTDDIMELYPYYPEEISRTSGDSPIYHGTTYMDFSSTLQFHGFTLEPHINMQHNGFSYGVYTYDAIVFFPKITIGYDNEFELFGLNFLYGGKLGNFDNDKTYEGLTIHNLDVQADYLYLKQNHLRLWHMTIGDLIFHPALNINDQIEHGIAIDSLNIVNDYKLDLKAGIDYYLDSRHEWSKTKNPYTSHVSIAFFNSFLRLYSQIGYRFTTDKESFWWRTEDKENYLWNSAFLTGLKLKLKEDVYDIDISSEFRYYGLRFNGELFLKVANFTGNPDTGRKSNIYPVYLYDRPFSQWAVYTEYQWHNVMGLTFRCSGKYRLYKNLMAIWDLDANYIRASGEDWFLYPFTTVSLAYEPVKHCYMSVGVTNKTMNMDKNYITFYLLKNFFPLFQVKIDY